jgi:hypothetical protein
MIRLRLPEDDLINRLADLLEEEMDMLSAKDVALVGWALARTKVPSDSSVYKKLKAQMVHLLETQAVSKDEQAAEDDIDDT